MIIAVDTGGTKTLIVAFSEAGQALGSRKFPTPRDEQEYIQKVVEGITALVAGQPPTALSVAVPGVVRNQIAIVCKNLGWHNFDVLGQLKQHFPDAKMCLENDANLGAVGASYEISPRPKKLFYITISTGIGGGFVVDGQIEANISENEVGDICFEYDGKITSWEDLASGNAIMRDFGLYANQLENPEDIEEIATRISRGLMTLLPTLRPDTVAIGGGFGAHYEIFDKFVQRELIVLPEQYRCPTITAPHPEEIVAYGCYHFAKNQLSL